MPPSSSTSTSRHSTNRRSSRWGQTFLAALISGVLSFQAGWTLGATAANSTHNQRRDVNVGLDSDCEASCQKQIQRALQKQQQALAAAAAPPPSDEDPRFPESVSDIATGMARVNRDDLAEFLHLGVPLDESSSHNNEAIILYQSTGAIPIDNPILAQQVQSNVQPPLIESVHEATQHCDYFNLVFTDHNPKNRHQCWAIMGQYESFHVQKYMRVENAKVDSTLPLRFVNRGYQSSGRKSLKAPALQVSRQYWEVLQTYLVNLDDTLEKLKPLAEAAATGGDSIIVMVVNVGQAALLVNFLCAAMARDLQEPLKHILIFATDQATVDWINHLKIPGVHVFFDETNFGDMPEQAARRYADQTFMRMMMAKVFSVHLTMALGYSVIFQDADVVWYQNPLVYFEKQKEAGEFLFDAYFQDDGNHALFYAPYSANTGFYYLRHSERTLALVNSLLLQGDLIIQTKSHQIPLTFILQEMASLHGLTIYVFNAKTTSDFPGGHTFHRRKDFMKDMIAGSVKPYLFHMSWTASKVNKVKFWQQLGEWYVAETCTAVDTADGVRTLLDQNKGCCIATPEVTCHYMDKPSKIPCKESPPIDKNGQSFW